MKKWLTSILLLFALVGGVVAGLPLHSSNGKMAECCSKAKSGESTPEANAARLCCIVSCSNSTPSSFGIQLNFSPALLSANSTDSQKAALFHVSRSQLPVFGPGEKPLGQQIQPKYIQHHSFLI